MSFTFFLVILIVALSPVLAFNGLTVDQLINWFNHHPLLTIIIIGDLFSRCSFKITTNEKNKEIV